MISFVKKKRIMFCAFLLGTVFLVILGLVYRRVDGAPRCTPVIAVQNYGQFSQLFQNIVKNHLIMELKAVAAKEFSLSYKPGNFTDSINNDLAYTTDFLSATGAIINEGLMAQNYFVSSGMGPANFTNMINKAALTALNDELRQLRIDTKDLSAMLNTYEKILNSADITGTYSGAVNEYRSMVSDFLPVLSNVMAQMTGLSGKIDVASSLGSNRKDVLAITRETLGECGVYTRDGLKVLGNIASQTIGDSVSADFAAANSKYLNQKLGKLRSRDGKPALSAKDVEKVILMVNNAAMHVVPRYIAGSTASLVNIASRTIDKMGDAMNSRVRSSLAAINVAIGKEKESENVSKQIYSSIEKDVIGLIGDKRKYEAFAREKNAECISDNNSLKKIMVLFAGREPLINLKKLAIRHYITAVASSQFAASIKTHLSKFKPDSLDKGYEDQAWKDLARFQYYLLALENQQFKLMAIRAMVEAVGTEDPEVLRYAAGKGLLTD